MWDIECYTSRADVGRVTALGGGGSKKVKKGRVRVKYCGALELKVEKGRIRSACSHKTK